MIEVSPRRTIPARVPPMLAGLSVNVSKHAELPAIICARHLALLGAVQDRGDACDNCHDPSLAGQLTVRSNGRRDSAGALDCEIYWQPSHQGSVQQRGSEAVIQALAGLMAVHGREMRVPRRLGLPVASIAAGVVAAQGVLAALIGRCRGCAVGRVESSVLQASLLFLRHHLAMATCGDDVPLTGDYPGSGPPFATADGHYVEFEVLSFGCWIAFWTQLGVEQHEAEEGWSNFVFRYLTARCTLPVGLHRATKRHSLEQLQHVAHTSGIALGRVRDYPELLAERKRAGKRGPAVIGDELPWTIRPGVRSRAVGDPLQHVDAPLTGLTVIEVTSRLQGPLAGLLLRSLGADVIKVEPPGGDFGRHAPPLAGSYGAAYLAYNHGKRVVEIDYKRSEGRAQLADLARDADVFLHNWRPGRAEQLELDFGQLVDRNPGLVYAYASGWGQERNPPSPIAGDFIVQAYAACGAGLNPVGEPPFPSRLTLVDVMGGLLACEGILAGIYLRERHGRGCQVDTSLLAGALMLEDDILRAIVIGQEDGRAKGRPLWRPLDQPIETTEGYLVVSVENEGERRCLAEVCELAPIGAPETSIVERLAGHPAAVWEQFLTARGIPAAAVREDLTSIVGDPLTAGLLERVDDACWLPRAPWQFAVDSD